MQPKEVEINEIWDDIELFFKENAPDMLRTINAGISALALTTFEKYIGFMLPDDYKISLQRHNGDVYLYSFCYLPLDVVQEKWEMMKRLKTEGVFSNRIVDGEETGVIQDLWWHEFWIPFAEDGGGNFLCIDMAPGPNGSLGQIIQVERDEGAFESKFKSFSEWLIDYRDGLNSGKFVVNDVGTIDEA